MSGEIRKWEKRASRVLSDHRIFKIREDRTTNPRPITARIRPR